MVTDITTGVMESVMQDGEVMAAAAAAAATSPTPPAVASGTLPHGTAGGVGTAADQPGQPTPFSGQGYRLG